MTGGPLEGVRVVELSSIGPGPHGAMLLADMGADVVRVGRPPRELDFAGGGVDWVLRGRRSVAANLKDPAERESVLRLIEHADVLIEGNRPGVAERLGLGPEECLARNPGLIYARVTGWGQSGPRALQAGHELNYLSITGGLHAIGPADGPPTPPLNLVGDIAGGSLMMVTGVLAAIIERSRTGRGQVLDVAMVDGALVSMQMFWAMRGIGLWHDSRGSNLIDGGCPFYSVYPARDGQYLAVACLELAFYQRFVALLGYAADELPDRDDPQAWPELRERIASRIAERDREEWVTVFDGTDACVTPVLSFADASNDPHLRARGSIVDWGGIPQAAPAPRFSTHPVPRVPSAPDAVQLSIDEVVASWQEPR